MSLMFVPLGKPIEAVGGYALKGIGSTFNKMETNALIKMSENLPKNAVYNAETKLINYKGKDYAVAGIDSVSGQPIFGQVLNGKLTGNYKMFVGGTAMVSKKPAMPTYGSSTLLKDIKYEFVKNPYFYTTVGVGGVEIVNDIFNDSMPPSTNLGTIGATIKDLLFSDESNIKKTFGIENER